MYWFLVPLITGFACHLASAFADALSRRWGPRRTAIAVALLRNILGVPLWAAGFVMAARHWAAPLLHPSTLTAAAGWLLAATGATFILMALAVIGRRAFWPEEGDRVAREGIYARVRHPIHAGVLLEFAGLILIRPTLPVVIAGGTGALWALLQTLAEEHDLARRLPGYRRYMADTSRFIPRLGGARHPAAPGADPPGTRSP
jgi:protein-S-isoprenylcysteine O-methyltransferase Ste14